MNVIIVELKTYTFKTLVGKTVKCSAYSIVSMLISVVQYIVFYQRAFLNYNTQSIVSGDSNISRNWLQCERESPILFLPLIQNLK